MRKKFLFCLLLLLFVLSIVPVAFASNVIIVLVDGQKLDTNPIIIDGRTLVPMRSIFESLGANIEWEQTTKTAIAKKGENEIKITLGHNKALLNGQHIDLDVPAQLINGYTMVPLRFVGEALDAEVDWDDSTKTIKITSSNEETNQNSISFQEIHDNSRSYNSIEQSQGCEQPKIKGNKNSMIYHVPGGQFYDRTTANVVYFCTETEAEDAGYRKSKR